QGSARDIIILSLCVNHPEQFRQIVSLSADGTDRKLNVALTRARHQFILVANPAMTAHNPLYAKLVAACQTVELEV
ncbi:MAG: AAA domain-containing protein, partial [Saprospiraceae bacterium]|nr:AAA domain-containing protein [Saprospiraceae bacterium]